MIALLLFAVVGLSCGALGFSPPAVSIVATTPTTTLPLTSTITTVDPRIIFPRWSLGTAAERRDVLDFSPRRTSNTATSSSSSSPYVTALFARTSSTNDDDDRNDESSSSTPNWNQQADDYAASGIDPNETIARRVIVTGDVDGGYYRSCVKNEASRFRKLIGTMSPPDDDNNRRAEIYVEGKRKMVDGFVRWCKRGDVGLSQAVVVESVVDEYPTGLYDDFYVHTGR
jgi:acylphosphatase